MCVYALFSFYFMTMQVTVCMFFLCVSQAYDCFFLVSQAYVCFFPLSFHKPMYIFYSLFIGQCMYVILSLISQVYVCIRVYSRFAFNGRHHFYKNRIQSPSWTLLQWLDHLLPRLLMQSGKGLPCLKSLSRNSRCLQYSETLILVVGLSCLSLLHWNGKCFEFVDIIAITSDILVRLKVLVNVYIHVFNVFSIIWYILNGYYCWLISLICKN